MNILQKITLLPIKLFCYPLFLASLKNKLAQIDFQRWKDYMHLSQHTDYNAFCFLMRYYPNHRSLLYYRVGKLYKHTYGITMPGIANCYISASCQGGVLIEHGYSSIIVANKIGENFFFHQNCTVGHNHGGKPTIGNNVTLFAGAVVAGPIIIGDNVKIGANALVLQDIPDNSIVYGNPCIIKSNKIQTHISHEKNNASLRH